MTHLYIELNTGLTEEVNSSIISKLYELAISGDLDNTSDLKGRLHSSTAKEKHVTYLNNNFDELYITADTLYLSFDDPDMETYMKRYIGTNEGVSLLDVLTFITSGTSLGDSYANTHGGDSLTLFITESERASIDSFNEISLFNGVTTLGNNSFDSSNISSITLPSSITTLREWAFSNCTNLTSINLDNIQYLYKGSFYNSGLTGIINLSSIKQIGVNGGMCFMNCSNITEINCGNSLEQFIGSENFSGCTALTKVTGLSNLTSIPNSTFYNCTNLSSVDIDWTKITSLLIDCFNGCSSLPLTNLSIPNLTSLGTSVFGGCKQLTSIDLSLSSIAVVSRQVFEGCNNLSKLKFPSTVINLDTNWCSNISSTLYITGLDNINTHSEYNWLITNKNILNPIKDSLSTGGAIIRNTGNGTVTSIHSLYEPTRVSTPKGYFELSYNLNGWLVYASGGNAMMNIGLLYLRDITSFGYVTFYRCNITNLVINNITPPTHSTNTSLSSNPYYTSWGNSIFGDLTSSGVGEKAFIGTLWVPDSAVATYLADPQYSGLTIKGINTKTNGVDYDLPRYADFSAWEAAEEAAVAQGGHAPQGLIESWM